MGAVYRARDPVLDRFVALKTLSAEILRNPDSLVRFQREARAAARLHHTNIVTIFELGEADGAPYIAMELLEGMDLAEAMSPADRLTVEEKVRIIVDVCRGLDYAHKNGVIHRDVKPANIRLLRDGSVKIVDFGIARLGESTLTETGLVLGTPSYLSPEVLLGGRVDHRADMWAAGVMLYELLTGRKPFQAPTFPGLAYRIIHDELPPVDARALGLPAVAEVLARALAKDPGQRFRDLSEMASALAHAIGRDGTTEASLSAQAREQACRRNLDDARRFLAGWDLERALQAARRAQALEPSRTEVVALVEEIEDRLSQEGPPTVDATAFTPTPTTSRRPLPTPVLVELRARGASVFREVATFGEPPATQAISFSPKRNILATAGSDGALRLWDLTTRVKVATLRSDMHRRAGHDARPLCLTFSPSGDLLASGHVDGAVHVWDTATQKELPVKLRHDDMVGALAFSPDGTRLASGGLDSNLKFWDIATAQKGDARREMHRQPAGVTSLAYAGGGRFIVTGHSNRLLRLIDAQTARLVAMLRGPQALVNLLCASPDGNRLAAASHDKTVRIFDIESRAQVAMVEGQRRPATSLCFFDDGKHLATVALENVVQLWDLESGTALASLWGPASESFAGVALFGGGDHVAVALADGRIRLWEPAS